jgi:hypothetical protein
MSTSAPKNFAMRAIRQRNAISKLPTCDLRNIAMGDAISQKYKQAIIDHAIGYTAFTMGRFLHSKIASLGSLCLRRITTIEDLINNTGRMLISYERPVRYMMDSFLCQPAA